jgi:hypothetical protein
MEDSNLILFKFTTLELAVESDLAMQLKKLLTQKNELSLFFAANGNSITNVENTLYLRKPT